MNALVHTGSGTFERINRQRSIERVARDWCLTLRASQIIPIYPLREDVEPGMMFVVATSIDKLRDYWWNKRGYLPMDQELDRLPATALPYDNYYRGNFGIGTQKDTPEHWRFPVGPAGGGNSATSTAWVNAPMAGFPSYSYKIRRGEGMSGALPVHGVPVAMSALGARSASVSVTLKECYTYGVSEKIIRKAVASWEGDYRNRFLLGHHTPENGHYKYLRVVSRVYLVKTVNVAVTSDDASSAQLSVGQPKPVQNIFVGQGDAEGNFEKATQANPDHTLVVPAAGTDPTPLPESTPADPGVEIPGTTGAGLTATQRRERELALQTKETNLALQQAKLSAQQSEIRQMQRRTTVAEAVSQFGGTVIPGVTTRITSASSSSVSMDETFVRPIVVGYEAFDFAIVPTGYGEAILTKTPVSAFLNMEGQAPQVQPGSAAPSAPSASSPQ